MSPLSPPRPSPRPHQGFTLLEVMVAVVILATALAAIIGGFAQQANLSAELRDRTLAMLVARNRLAEITLDEAFPRTGKSEGEAQLADNAWEWFAEVSETEDEALRRIDIRVLREGSERELATLSAFVASTGRSEARR